MLSKEQLHFLRKLFRTEKYYFSDEESAIISYLLSNGYISKAYEGGNRWGNGEICFCTITEKGKAYLYDIRKSNLRFLIPVTISACSLIVSTIALCLSLG